VREPPLDRAAARAQLGIAPNTWVMGWVGRLTGEKGPDVFIDALAHVRRPEWTAVILGDGPRRPELEARAAALGLGARMRWCGVVPGAGRLYAAFDVFVLSSRTEGIPIVLFEAMAAGTPVVATRVGGVPDVVTEREGALVPPGDPTALAAAIDAVAADPRAASVRAAAARDVLTRRFALEPWLAAYDDAYEHAVARRGGAS
jgi:glycosyltransferase involved in cell wall biosynthesis